MLQGVRPITFRSFYALLFTLFYIHCSIVSSCGIFKFYILVVLKARTNDAMLMLTVVLVMAAIVFLTHVLQITLIQPAIDTFPVMLTFSRWILLIVSPDQRINGGLLA